MSICLFLLLLFSVITFGAVEPGPTALIEAITLTLAFRLLFQSLSKGRIRVVSSPLHPAAFLFFGLTLYQLTGLPGASIYPYATQTVFLKYLTGYLFFCLVTDTVQSGQKVYWAFFSVLLLSVIVSGWGIMEVLANAQSSHGPFVNRNHYANYLAMTIIFSLGLFLVSDLPMSGFTRRNDNHPPREKNLLRSLNTPRPLLFILAAFSSVGLFFAFSRGGIVAFAAGLLILGILLILRRPFQGKALLIPALSLCLLSLLLWVGVADKIWARISTVKEISLSSDQRALVWRSTLDIFHNFPITGTGLGTFSQIFPAYRTEAIVKKFFSFAHNEYLQLLSETGLVGFTIVFVGFAAFFFLTIQRFFQRHDRAAIALTAVCLASLCAGFIHAFVDFPFQIPANGLLLALILGVATITSQGRFDRNGTIYLHARTFLVRKRAVFKILLTFLYLFLLGLVIQPALADYVSQKDLGLAMRIAPKNAEYHFRLAQSLLKDPGPSNLNLALKQLRHAVTLNRYNARYHQSLGWLYANLGYLAKAREELSLAIKLDPTNPFRLQAYQHWFP